MVNRVLIGKRGEEQALAYLVEQQFQPVEQNFRCRLGEVDLIAWDGDDLVFIEVKARTSNTFAAPEESVNYRKQHKLRKLAAYYLTKMGSREINCRFDVVTVLFDGFGKTRHIRHIPGAF